MTPVHLPAKYLVREAGVEPAASRLSIECSTTLSFSRMDPRARLELAFPNYKSGASPTMLTGLGNSGANGANRTLVGCLPCNCSSVELHRLEPEGIFETPTSALRMRCSSAWATLAWSECGESNSVDRTGDPMPSQWATPTESLERTEIIEISSLGWKPRAHPIYHAR